MVLGGCLGASNETRETLEEVVQNAGRPLFEDDILFKSATVEEFHFGQWWKARLQALWNRLQRSVTASHQTYHK